MAVKVYKISRLWTSGLKHSCSCRTLCILLGFTIVYFTHAAQAKRNISGSSKGSGLGSGVAEDEVARTNRT